MLRLVLMGTSDFAVPVFAEIFGQGYDIAAIYTRPPRPAGRGMKLYKSPVHLFADSVGLPVLAPPMLRNEEVSAIFVGHEADVVIVVSYGLMLPRNILEMPPYGCLNLHASLLPRWRGAAPVQRAVMAGDSETGVAIMRMDEGLDTGPVCLSERVAIGPDMTAGALHDILAGRGADLMIGALCALSCGGLDYVPQSEGESVTYARKISKDETMINWSYSARAVHDHIRGLSPSPGAWCYMHLGADTERVKILSTSLAEEFSGKPGAILDAGPDLIMACGTGAVRVHSLQRAGKKPVSTKEFLGGAFSLSSGDMVM
ncbi:MAG: methionyl-tRNA formyltransferase [Alphaproteobacteria bacterium]|nr:methionyl-tRNA formyltransferase [Alphaproteobacteria bacterium]